MQRVVFSLLAVKLLLGALVTDAWLCATPVRRQHRLSTVPDFIGAENMPQRFSGAIPHRCRQMTLLNAGGGFGGAGSTDKKESKLKPKQQWDRYIALKKESAVRVAVKVGTDAWLEVGCIKSQDSSMTEIAVARQRALIAEVRYVSRYFLSLMHLFIL